jgi:hypothetical protein
MVKRGEGFKARGEEVKVELWRVVALSSRSIWCALYCLQHPALLAHATWNKFGAGGSLEYRPHLLLTCFLPQTSHDQLFA